MTSKLLVMVNYFIIVMLVNMAGKECEFSSIPYSNAWEGYYIDIVQM